MLRIMAQQKKVFFAPIFLLIILGLSLSACEKDHKVEDGCDMKTPGPGGQVSIEGHVEHHGRPIPNARVFIKFGAIEFPGTDTTKYDYATTASSGDAHYQVEEMMPGDYYLYSVGYDSAIFQAVSGGVGTEITCKDHQMVETDIPVTE